MPSGETLAAFGATGATLAIHLSVHVLAAWQDELIPHYGADCPVAVVFRASWPDQRVVRATLATWTPRIGDGERTALILVGRALAARRLRRKPPLRRRLRPPLPPRSAPIPGFPNEGAGDQRPRLGVGQDHGHAGPDLRRLRARRAGGAALQKRAGLHRPGLSPRRRRAPAINLDSWAMPPGADRASDRRGRGADMALAEGSMGLFDGVAQPGRLRQWRQRRYRRADRLAGGAGAWMQGAGAIRGRRGAGVSPDAPGCAAGGGDPEPRGLAPARGADAPRAGPLGFRFLAPCRARRRSNCPNGIWALCRR
jgi:hypothetical protein